MERIWADRLLANDTVWLCVPFKRREGVLKELQKRLKNGEITKEQFNKVFHSE